MYSKFEKKKMLKEFKEQPIAFSYTFIFPCIIDQKSDHMHTKYSVYMILVALETFKRN